MTISYDDIAARAFQIWEREGRPENKDQEHWLQAEAELRAQSLKKQKGALVSSEDPAMLKPGKNSKQMAGAGKR